jgi:N,N'-diacetyllegionaminate synthase
MTIIIAEAGTNHADDRRTVRVHKAMRLASAAKHAGADFVKFQWFTGKPLFCPMEGDEARWARWRASVLSFDEWREVQRFCKDIGIGFLASVFDLDALDYLKLLKPRFYKVASRAADTFPYSKVPGPFLISNAFGKVPPVIGREYFLLDCSPKYPTPLEEARWDHRTSGLSDHSGSIWPGIDAILRGAGFLEVHFGVDLRDCGPDTAVCLTEHELATLCEARDAASALCEN